MALAIQAEIPCCRFGVKPLPLPPNHLPHSHFYIPVLKGNHFFLVTGQNVEVPSLIPLPSSQFTLCPEAFLSPHPDALLPSFSSCAASSNPTQEPITHQFFHFLPHPWGIPEAISAFRKGEASDRYQGLLHCSLQRKSSVPRSARLALDPGAPG